MHQLLLKQNYLPLGSKVRTKIKGGSKWSLLFHIIHILSGMVALVQISKSFGRDEDRYDQIANSIENLLMELGLTQKESSTYLFLNKSGSKKAYEIAENQRVARTQVYRFLTVLQNKGLITIISDSPTKFEGIELKRALKILIDSEKQRLEQINLTRNELCELWKENFYK